MPVSNKLKEIRTSHNCQQKQIAAAIGTCPRSISNIERGEYCPSLENALRIARYLQVRVEDIFVLTDEDIPSP